MMTLKKTFTFWMIALLAPTATWAQTTIRANKAEIKNELKVAGKAVKGISNATTIGTGSADSLITQKAVKDYVTASVTAGNVALAAAKPSPITTYTANVVIDTVGTDTMYVWNASRYMRFEAGSGGGGAPSGAAGGDLTGTYPDPLIGNDKVISAYVLDGTLVNEDLASQTVDSNKIKNRAITTEKLKDNAVTAAKIGAGEVGSSELASTAVTAGSYTSADITVDADGRITAAANGSGGSSTVDTALVLSSGLLAKAANVYGTTRLVAGAEKALRVKRADGLESDFTFLRNGYIDANQLENFLNGQIGYVIKFYDQKGTNHAVQSNISFAPTITNYNGIIRVDFHAAGLKNLKYNTSSALANNSSALFLVWNSSTASQFSNLSSSTAYIAKGTGFAVQFTNTTTPKLVLQVENGGTRSTTAFPVGHDNTLLVNNATANSTVKANERTSTITAGSGTTASSWSMGDSLNFWTGNVMAWVHFGDDLTTLEADTIQAMAKNNFALRTKSETEANLVFEGNSITNGSADPEYRGWTERLVGQGKTHKANLAVSGSVVSDLVARAHVVDSLYLPGKKNVLVVWAGTNDIFNNSSASGATYNALADYMSARKVKGYKIIALTCIPRSTPGANRDTCRQNFNTLLKASTIPDYVIDVAADTAFKYFIGYASSAHYYRQYLSDGIHPTQEGHKRLAAITQPTISMALSQSVETPKNSRILDGVLGASTIYANQIYGKNPAAFNSTLVIASNEGGNGTAEAGTLIFNPGPYNWITMGYPSRQAGTFAYRFSGAGGARLTFEGGTSGSDVQFGFGSTSTSFYTPPAGFRLSGTTWETNTNDIMQFSRGGSPKIWFAGGGVGILKGSVNSGFELDVNGEISGTRFSFGSDLYNGLFGGAGTPEGSVLGTSGALYLRNNGSGHARIYVKTTGSSGSPTTTGWVTTLLEAVPIVLPAGTATASTAPLKFTSGTNLTTPEAGAIEYDGTEFYSTNASGRAIFARVLKGSNTLDFGSTAAGAVTDLTITVTGAADGDVVSLSVPNASQTTTGTFSAWVSATNTVTVRYRIAALTGSEDPASGVFKVTVTK